MIRFVTLSSAWIPNGWGRVGESLTHNLAAAMSFAYCPIKFNFGGRSASENAVSSKVKVKAKFPTEKRGKEGQRQQEWEQMMVIPTKESRWHKDNRVRILLQVVTSVMVFIVSFYPKRGKLGALISLEGLTVVNSLQLLNAITTKKTTATNVWCTFVPLSTGRKDQLWSMLEQCSTSWLTEWLMRWIPGEGHPSKSKVAKFKAQKVLTWHMIFKSSWEIGHGDSISW